MDPEQTAAMREIIHYLDSALTIADRMSQSLLGAQLSECLEHARQTIGAAIAGGV